MTKDQIDEIRRLAEKAHLEWEDHFDSSTDTITWSQPRLDYEKLATPQMILSLLDALTREQEKVKRLREALEFYSICQMYTIQGGLIASMTINVNEPD